MTALESSARPERPAKPEPAWTLLGDLAFRRYWTGQAISLVGDQITLLAVPLLAVLMLDATPAQMGYLTAAGLAPSLIFSLYAGVWVDRRASRRLVMVWADIGRALLIATVPVAYVLDTLSLNHLYVVAFGVGTLAALFEVANATLFVSLVPPQRYVAANSLINGSRAMSFVVGPSAAGWLVQLLTAPVALIADALSYVGSAIQLSRIRPTEPPAETERKGQLGAGARFLAGSRALWTLIVAVTTLNFFNYMFATLVILYVTTFLGVSPGLIGLILGAASVGALLGSVITGRLTRAVGVGPAYVIGLIAFPAPLVLVPLAGGPRPAVLAMLFLAEFGSGLGVMILDISAGSLIAAIVPNRLRARVAGVTRTINYGIRPIGALAGGALGTALGVRPTLWVATIGALAGALWMIGSPVVRMRDLPSASSEDEPTPAEASER
jgi:MFS family permease